VRTGRAWGDETRIAIDPRVIADNWDEILRLAASIKAGTVAPSAILRRLAAYPRQNALAKALREIGRLERTLFTFDWISDPALRRRTNAGLNKGEARNALARAVFFHRLGEIRDRREPALNLLCPRKLSSFCTRVILNATKVTSDPAFLGRITQVPCFKSLSVAGLYWETKSN
jgi:TnpA family transposase